MFFLRGADAKMEMKEAGRWQDASAEGVILQVDHGRRHQAFGAPGKMAVVGSSLKDRDEDLALIDLFLMPMAIATCLLGMGSGLLICFLVW